MPVTFSPGRLFASPDQADRLECPRCRGPATGDDRGSGSRCPACGLLLVPSIRKSEADAWRRLYGGPPRRLV